MNPLILAPVIAAAATISAAIIGPLALARLQNRRSKAITEACKRNLEIMKLLDEQEGLTALKADLVGMVGVQVGEMLEADARTLLQRKRDWVLVITNAYMAIPLTSIAVALWPPKGVWGTLGFAFSCLFSALTLSYVVVPITAPEHPFVISMSEAAWWNRKKLKSSPGDTRQNWPKMREWLIKTGVLGKSPQQLARERALMRMLARGSKGKPQRLRLVRRTFTRRR